jgi:acetyl-CoA/propionyl-CoA carboxylase biotin carboxyl carrier protein
VIERVLVANRGEIAVRVIRACHRLGRAAVVVYSEPDADSMAVSLADDAFALTGSTAVETYLDVDRVAAAAVASGCDAVHPGYGFLAERADFARAVTAASLTWIGPPADVIALMGDKLAARNAALAAGVPPVPGATVAVEEPAAVVRIGEELGWPLAVKAVHGGGGRGMRVVAGIADVADSLGAARRESQSSFGRPEVYVERYLTRPRHVEVQIVADHHGSLVAVGDRDCSIQRRYQKLIEEAPAPELSDSLRCALADAAVRLARSVGYTNAGTVEFLVDDGELFFLEMNTRIQVEHPVTELVTGVDLVAEQVLVADGRPLSFGSEDVTPRGAAIEVRINAEDPAGGRFLPTPGTLRRFELPTGPRVRVDTGFRTGDELPPHYDNLIAKIVVWGDNREDARRLALQALHELNVDGVPTTGPAAAAVLAHDDFRASRHSTRWLTEHADELFPTTATSDVVTTRDVPAIAATPAPRPPVEVEVLGRRYRIPRFGDGSTDYAGDGSRTTGAGGPPRERAASAVSRHTSSGRVIAPMQGTVTTVEVGVGDAVHSDSPVLVLEAMKMENTLVAGIDGVVKAVHVAAGASVAPGALLVEVEAL